MLQTITIFSSMFCNTLKCLDYLFISTLIVSILHPYDIYDRPRVLFFLLIMSLSVTLSTQYLYNRPADF